METVKKPRVGTPRPFNGGSRKGAGRPPQRLLLKPFSADKGRSISTAIVTLYRCNACGAMGYDAYTEVVAGAEAGDIVRIEHPAMQLVHRGDCNLV